jgi:methyltransferase (TIGR00027 family)
MARALAHGTSRVEKFSDPTAFSLLPESARVKVERFRAELPEAVPRRRAWLELPKRSLTAVLRKFTEKRSLMMAVRTVAVDEGVRAAAAPQLVILGAGLDGRAWRMPELGGSVVFEVDHPDSQGAKRARIGALTQRARTVQFVPFDFEREQLGEALARHGHDCEQATTWIWEGVVMYLAEEAIDATLTVVARRSTPGSRLIIVYHTQGLLLPLIGWLVRHVGEPLRSVFTPNAMRELLHQHGFAIMDDQALPAIAAAWSPELGRATRLLSHIRVVSAERAKDRAPATN